MKVLITGACGFVGKKLAVYLANKGFDVLATGKLNTVNFDAELKFFSSNSSNNNSGQELSLKYLPLDILDSQTLSKTLSSFLPDVIYHLAAVTFIPTAEKEFETTLKVNVLGTENLLAEIKLNCPKAKLVFASSGEAYGKASPTDIPLSESSPVKPANRYSLSKVMAELAVTRYSNYEGLNTTILRLFNHTGAGQPEQFVIPSFASQLAKIAQKKQEPIIKVGNLSAYRDFTDVKDVLRAYELVAEKGSGIYNICSGRSVKLEDALNKLIYISGVSVEVVVDPERFRPVDTPEICGTNEKINKEVGWKPLIAFEDTLKEIWNFYSNFRCKEITHR